jgi:uncharacterized protein YigA (DUF484 family)
LKRRRKEGGRGRREREMDVERERKPRLEREITAMKSFAQVNLGAFWGIAQ